MSTITVEQLNSDEFEPGDQRLAALVESIQSGVEQVKSLKALSTLRDVGRSAVLGVSTILEVPRPGYWRPGDNKESKF